MRLNQFIAKATGISRRKADDVIKSKKVKVNGNLGQLSDQVTDTDEILYDDGKGWKSIGVGSDSSQVVLMYKKLHVMTTRHDPEGRKTVYDNLPSRFKNYKTAGRLDYMSEGLLALSPNGHPILSMTHPKFKTKKVYLVGLTAPLSASDISRARSGEIEIEGYKLNPVEINAIKPEKYSYLKPEKSMYWYTFTLTEGRNRQIRKMAHVFKKPVRRLIRIKHGQFELTEEIFRRGYVERTLSSF